MRVPDTASIASRPQPSAASWGWAQRRAVEAAETQPVGPGSRAPRSGVALPPFTPHTALCVADAAAGLRRGCARTPTL